MITAKYRPGLCCIHNGFKSDGLGFQTMTVTQFNKLPREKSLAILGQRYENNLNLLFKILEYCGRHGWCYRISSSVFPILSHRPSQISWEDIPNFRELDAIFAKCAKMIYTDGIRISSHPDQFNVLASENQDAVDRTIHELDHQGWMMNKLTPDSYLAPMNIHLNCSRGDPKEVAKRFFYNFQNLSEFVKKRLVLENEDRGIWDVTNILDHICSIIQIPITFDYLHHKCNGKIAEKDAFLMCHDTWKHTIPLFHYSESIPGCSDIRRHADYPLERPNTYDKIVDLDYEFKDKDWAILRHFPAN